MTDRIDQMTHEELKAASRELVKAVTQQEVRAHSCYEATALKTFQPSTLDKVRELLKAEGWGPARSACGSPQDILIRCHKNGNTLHELWEAP